MTDLHTAPVRVHPGPVLLAGIEHGPSYAAHLAFLPPLPRLDLAALLDLVSEAGIAGRGGAGFPLARKISTVAQRRGRPHVVVNAAEGEPASAKDGALLTAVPHRVLDGAVVAAKALGAKEIHVVTAADRPHVGDALQVALHERRDRGIHWRYDEATPRFVAGQARAVLELLAGRANLPVTAWEPEAVKGHRGRPTLLSNAETYAQLAALVRDPEGYRSHGSADEPGTTLLTVSSVLPGSPVGAASTVVEVEHGAPFGAVLDDLALASPVLTGGYHGTWAPPDRLRSLTVSRRALRQQGIALGAGVLVPLVDGSCPVARSADVTTYLAGESAGRCGPCRFGLPALAEEVRALADGADTTRRIRELTGLVTGRGACAHPDGTARLVASLLTNLSGAVAGHLEGRCSCAARGRWAA